MSREVFGIIIKDNIDNLECEEIRIFNYSKMVEDIGALEKYKAFDGWECEEVRKSEIIEDEEILTEGWEIIGTNRIVEKVWTTPK